MIENWKSAIDSGEMAGDVAIDLSKDFDSLPSGLLISNIAAPRSEISSCKLVSR